MQPSPSQIKIPLFTRDYSAAAVSCRRHHNHSMPPSQSQLEPSSRSNPRTVSKNGDDAKQGDAAQCDKASFKEAQLGVSRLARRLKWLDGQRSENRRGRLLGAREQLFGLGKRFGRRVDELWPRPGQHLLVIAVVELDVVGSWGCWSDEKMHGNLVDAGDVARQVL
jgi:hypothetical protein